jgi:hypothetical protein
MALILASSAAIASRLQWLASDLGAFGFGGFRSIYGYVYLFFYFGENHIIFLLCKKKSRL